MSPAFFSFTDPGAVDWSDPFMMFIMFYYGSILLSTLIFSVVVFILQATSLREIAKRRGIHHPWLAWVPVGNAWILGSISDQYQYVVKGKIRNRRKILLWLSLGTSVVYTIFMVVAIKNAIAAVDIQSGAAYFYSVLPMMSGVYISNALMTVFSVFQNIAFFDLYRSCNPRTAVVYLVLSIVIGVVAPFFIFTNRKKDYGMPPRRVHVPPVIDV